MSKVRVFVTIVILLAMTEKSDARHIHHRHHSIIRSHNDVVDGRLDWPGKIRQIIYPYATGTSVLDQYSGRWPSTSDRSCSTYGSGL
jgi:hypothetical protein